MKTTFWIALIVMLLPMQARADAAAQDAATAAAESWLAMVDKGAYAESWDNAAQLFKGAVSLEQWEQSLEAVRGPLGELTERSVKSQTYATSLPGAPDGEYFVIEFSTRFTHKAAAVETVTPMRDADGEWRVAGYFIR